ncbi:MAG TPA: carboxypeptidase-like regulatory domain-containing protein [Ktedonobacteraceae bacterium]|nr:carboxypeptidase-like regulatory domain-containing protein [Ktedonobacteraceae bacterium]
MPAHAAGGNGRIYGQLLDGTAHNAPLAGQVVTLQMAQGSNAQDLATATTDSHGNFSFPGLSTDKTISYAVFIRYQGAQYVSDLVSLDSKPEQQVNLTVYQATTSTANIAIIQATALLHAPDAQKSSFTVSELFIFKNLDTHAFVGSLDTSKGRPNALIFSLPRGARNITFNNGFDGYKAIQVDSGFATDAALPPGNTEFSFTFEVPYTASTYDFSYAVMYPTVSLSFLVSPEIHASSSSLTSQGVITADQHPYHLFKADAIRSNQEVHLSLEGLSLPAKPAALNAGAIWLIVALLLMLSLLAVTWFIYRNRRNSSQPAATSKGKAAAKDRKQALLQELLDLDTAFEAGKLSKATYQERRAKAKARLRTLMSEQEMARR